MILSVRHLDRMVKRSMAKFDGVMYDWDTNKSYRVYTRHDIQRVDHAFIGYGDMRD
jgi:hypothetical protein